MCLCQVITMLNGSLQLMAELRYRVELWSSDRTGDTVESIFCELAYYHVCTSKYCVTDKTLWSNHNSYIHPRAFKIYI